MTSTVQALAPIDQPVITLLNPVLSAPPPIIPLLISRTGSNLCIGRRTSDNALAYSSDEMATWTILTNKPADKPVAIIETYDGELLVLGSSSGNPSAAGVNVVYKTTGWATNKQGVTFTSKKSFGGVSAGINAGWAFSNGSVIPPNATLPNGAIVTNLYGTQSQATGDNTLRAVYSYVTFDHGETWVDLLSLLNAGTTNPLGVHFHGCYASALDNRAYLSFGDNTGNGPAVAGAGKMQVAYVNLEDLTYGFLPLPPQYTVFTGGNALQFTGIRGADDGSLSFTPDTAPFAILVLGRTGYRQFNNMHWTVPMGTGDARTIGGGIVQVKPGDPAFTSFQMDATSNGLGASNTVPAFYVAVTGNDWQVLWTDAGNPLSVNEQVYMGTIGMFASKKFVGFYTSTEAGLGTRMLTGTVSGI